MKKLVNGRTDFDWCWFPIQLLSELRTRGMTKWFKCAFHGAELLPDEGVDARHLTVRSEGDGSTRLLKLLTENYGHATALVQVATILENQSLEQQTQEVAHYQGQFSARGNSFDLHLDFVLAAMRTYREWVRIIEDRYRLEWKTSSSGGLGLHGEVVELHFGKQVPDFELLVSGLFSSRDPFRLWAVPRMTEDYAEARVVDLHVGTAFDMQLTPHWIRMMLPEQACGNTVLRLLSNLQRHLDASVTPNALELAEAPAA